MPTRAERVLAYFDPKHEQALAVRVLRSYFSSRCFTGSAFDRLANDSDPWRYTAEDFLAVSTLSVNVPARAALALLDSSEVQGTLREIPVGATLWERPELLDRSGPIWELWDQVARHHGVGRTIASKLLAVKRPRLVPVFDGQVDDALDLGKRYWAFWQEVVRSDESSRLRGLVRGAGYEAQVPEWVSELRIIDVVVWMRHHGARRHVEQGCTSCDLASTY